MKNEIKRLSIIGTAKTAKAEIVRFAKEASYFPCIRALYEFKRRYTPQMQGFEAWLEEDWALRIFLEANVYCGGYTPATAKKIMDIEYLGTPLVLYLKEKIPNLQWCAYVEEGCVTVSFSVPIDVKVMFEGEQRPLCYSELWTRLLVLMRDHGFADAEKIEDFSLTEMAFTGTRKFFAPFGTNAV